MRRNHHQSSAANNRGRPQQYRPKFTSRYVTKSQLVPPPPAPNSVAAEQAAPDDDHVGKNHHKGASESELNGSNIDETNHVAGPSEANQEDDDINDLMGRLDKLLTEIDEPGELSEDQIAINDQLQQDEVIITLQLFLLIRNYELVLMFVWFCRYKYCNHFWEETISLGSGLLWTTDTNLPCY